MPTNEHTLVHEAKRLERLQAKARKQRRELKREAFRTRRSLTFCIQQGSGDAAKYFTQRLVQILRWMYRDNLPDCLQKVQ